MNGREDKSANDLFFTCSLIDYIARKTNNKRRDVVNHLGKERIEKIKILVLGAGIGTIN